MKKKRRIREIQASRIRCFLIVDVLRLVVLAKNADLIGFCGARGVVGKAKVFVRYASNATASGGTA